MATSIRGSWVYCRLYDIRLNGYLGLEPQEHEGARELPVPVLSIEI